MKVDRRSNLMPDRMEAGTLEALFVQRESLAERIEDLVLESTRYQSKHHQLLVGAPGLGKTHLLALLHHRISGKAHPSLRVAWLREEEWGVTSFLDLLMKILEALDMEMTARSVFEAILDLDPAEAEREAGRALKEALGGTTLLIILENLHGLFTGLGRDGQERFRAYMQENPFIALLASTPALFDGISSRTAPFFGTFALYHLEPLNLEDTQAMLAKAAALHGDGELADYLLTPGGRSRVRAFLHLAEGNHRVTALFARDLTRESLDDLVTPVIDTLEGFAPFRRAWLGALPSQPLMIIYLLCRLRYALPVKDIARRCFLKHQIASSQLKLLRDKGYVRSKAVGRESYYEVSSRIMRLSVELKLGREESIRALVGFLKSWYAAQDDPAFVLDDPGSIIAGGADPAAWSSRARKLFDETRDGEGHSRLALGIAQSAATLKRHLVNGEGARVWLGIWKEVAGGAAPFGTGLSVLDAAIRYMENPDERVLLSLPAEEREILSGILSGVGS